MAITYTVPEIPKYCPRNSAKSFVIQDDDHFVTIARYVEGNPVRAGLVKSAIDWCWSSHRERCGLESDSLIVPLPVPFAGDWNMFVNTPMTLTELAKARKLIIRQKSDRKAGLRDSPAI